MPYREGTAYGSRVSLALARDDSAEQPVLFLRHEIPAGQGMKDILDRLEKREEADLMAE